MAILRSKTLLMSVSKFCTLAVVSTPANATCTLTYNGTSHTDTIAIVKKGTTVSYSVYHATYGTTTGTIVVDKDKTLLCTGTSSSSTVYVDTAWSQPSISANGTLGSGSFAVSPSSETSSNWKCYRAFGDYSNYDAWRTANSDTNPYCIIWSSTAIKIKTVTYTPYSSSYGNYCPTSISLYGSNTNSNFTLIGTVSNSDFSGKNNIVCNYTNSNYYKYYKIAFGLHSNNIFVKRLTLSAVYQTATTVYTYYWNTQVVDGGGEDVAWTRPNLTSNGTLGGNSFAVYAYNLSDAYKAVDGSSTTIVGISDKNPVYFYLYNPNSLKISQMIFRSVYANTHAKAVSLQGSMDNSIYEDIATTYSLSEYNSVGTLNITNPKGFNYYKIVGTPYSVSIGWEIADIAITATEKVYQL